MHGALPFPEQAFGRSVLLECGNRRTSGRDIGGKRQFVAEAMARGAGRVFITTPEPLVP